MLERSADVDRGFCLVARLGLVRGCLWLAVVKWCQSWMMIGDSDGILEGCGVMEISDKQDCVRTVMP